MGEAQLDAFAPAATNHRHRPVRAFPADWHRDGKAAGPIRNRRMLLEGMPDLVVAFPGGRGTADMVRRARAAGIEVVEPFPALSAPESANG